MFSIKATKFIQELCKSLEKIAISNFMHDITFGKNHITMLVSNPELFQFYYNNKIPTLCTDDSGRTLDDGIYINKLLQQQNKGCALLIPLMQKIGKRFGLNYGQNSLSIVVREKDCQHLYSLFFNLDEQDFLHWVINNGSFLQDLIYDYNLKAQDIILEAKAIENQIILPSYYNNNLFRNEEFNESKIPHICVIHKNMHVPIHLSNQQSKCLLLLMKGKTAKQIALEMKLSHRTVEHYLEAIRKLLGCTSNRELIVSYSEQLNEY